MRFVPSFLSLLLATSLGCSQAEPSADQPAPVAAAPVEKAPIEKAVEPAPAPPVEVTAPAEAAPVAVDPATLAGHVGFDWRRPKGARCRKVDAKLARILARASCRKRSADEAFADGAGEWVSCEVGKAEWLLYATRAICDEQLGTMDANGP